MENEMVLSIFTVFEYFKLYELNQMQYISLF